MSDKFNQAKPKETITRLLVGDRAPVPDGDVERLFPGPKTLPEDPVEGSKTALKWLKDNVTDLVTLPDGTRTDKTLSQVLNPIMVPENVRFGIQEVLMSSGIDQDSPVGELLVRAVEERPVKSRGILLPGGSEMRYPKYSQNHFIAGYDTPLYRQLLYQAVASNPRVVDRDASNTMKMCDIITRTHAFTNGTYTGQLNRWKKSRKIRLGLEGKVAPISMKQFGDNLVKTFPMLADRYEGLESRAKEGRPPMGYTPLDTIGGFKPVKFVDNVAFHAQTPEEQEARFLEAAMAFAKREPLKGARLQAVIHDPGDFYPDWWDFSKFLDYTMPLSTLPEEQPGLYYTPAGCINVEVEGDPSRGIPPAFTETGEGQPYFPSARPDTAAGIPYTGMSKGQTTPEAVIMATDMLKEWNAIVKSAQTGVLEPRLKGQYDMGKVNTGAIPTKDILARLRKQYLEKWAFLGLNVIFPKSERYEWENDGQSLLEKTRNIYMCPYPIFIAISIMSQRVTSLGLMRNCADEEFFSSPDGLKYQVRTPCLSKWHPFHGQMDKFVNDLLSTPKTTAIRPFIYADNLYIYDPRSGRWFSLDLEAGESNATREDAMMAIHQILTRVYVTQDGAPRFSSTWASWLMQCAPHFIVDATVVLFSLQLPMYGQGSGNPLTFFINHIKSSRLLLAILLFMDNGKEERDTGPFYPDLTFDEEQIQFFSKICGLNFRVEVVIEDLPGTLAVAKKEASRVYSPYTNPSPPSSKEPVETRNLPIVNLDLLGWATTWSSRYGWVPVLAPDRLLKSAMLPSEKLFDGEKGVSQDAGKRLRIMAMQICRYKALVMVGGYAFPSLERSCNHLAAKKFKDATTAAGKVGVSIEEFLTDAIATGELTNEMEVREVFEAFNSPNMHPEDVQKLWAPYSEASLHDRAKNKTPFTVGVLGTIFNHEILNNFNNTIHLRADKGSKAALLEPAKALERLKQVSADLLPTMASIRFKSDAYPEDPKMQEFNELLQTIEGSEMTRALQDKLVDAFKAAYDSDFKDRDVVTQSLMHDLSFEKPKKLNLATLKRVDEMVTKRPSRKGKPANPYSYQAKLLNIKGLDSDLPERAEKLLGEVVVYRDSRRTKKATRAKEKQDHLDGIASLMDEAGPAEPDARPDTDVPVAPASAEDPAESGDDSEEDADDEPPGKRPGAPAPRAKGSSSSPLDEAGREQFPALVNKRGKKQTGIIELRTIAGEVIPFSSAGPPSQKTLRAVLTSFWSQLPKFDATIPDKIVNGVVREYRDKLSMLPKIEVKVGSTKMDLSSFFGNILAGLGEVSRKLLLAEMAITYARPDPNARSMTETVLRTITPQPPPREAAAKPEERAVAAPPGKGKTARAKSAAKDAAALTAEETTSKKANKTKK